MTNSVVYTRRRVRDAVRFLLRSDSVRNFIWLYYFWFIAGSVDLTFYSYPIKLIADPMGQLVYNAWAWMPLVAAPFALIGLVLRHGGSPAEAIHGRLLRQDFTGLWMQVGGHAAMSLVLAVFIVTAWIGRAPHQPIPSAYWLMAYWMGVTFLCVQCFYKVGLGMGWFK
jgi:hypothetical protein